MFRYIQRGWWNTTAHDCHANRIHFYINYHTHLNRCSSQDAPNGGWPMAGWAQPGVYSNWSSAKINHLQSRRTKGKWEGLTTWSVGSSSRKLPRNANPPCALAEGQGQPQASQPAAEVVLTEGTGWELATRVKRAEFPFPSATDFQCKNNRYEEESKLSAWILSLSLHV